MSLMVTELQLPNQNIMGSYYPLSFKQPMRPPPTIQYTPCKNSSATCPCNMIVCTSCSGCPCNMIACNSHCGCPCNMIKCKSHFGCSNPLQNPFCSVFVSLQFQEPTDRGGSPCNPGPNGRGPNVFIQPCPPPLNPARMGNPSPSPVVRTF